MQVTHCHLCHLYFLGLDLRLRGDDKMWRATAFAFDVKGQGIHASSHPATNPLDLPLQQEVALAESPETIGDTETRLTPGARSFWLSVLIGAYAGLILQFLLASRGQPVDPSELWVLPFGLAIYGLLAIPFVASGLIVFGLPLTPLLKKHARRWWVGLIAVIWGALAGKLHFYAIDHLLFFGYYEFAKIEILDMGVIYGVPTGIAWWLLYRRRLSSED